MILKLTEQIFRFLDKLFSICLLNLRRTLSVTTFVKSSMSAPNGNRARILGIAGCTNSGKTTLALKLAELLDLKDVTTAVIHQDDFYLQPEKVHKVTSKANPSVFFYNYDEPFSVDIDSFVKKIKETCATAKYVFVEGNMLTEMKEVMNLMDNTIFLTMDQESCRQRRESRTYDPPDTEGYFDEIVFPEYVKHMKNAVNRARIDSKLTFLDVSSTVKGTTTMDDVVESYLNDLVWITTQKLNIENASKLVGSPSCGAISLFVGTTRDVFEGKKVIQLDYECYDEMAYKELRILCKRVRDRFTSVERILIHHRVGTVPVGEASVIIATSSPHRKDAISATEFAIDELKRTIPIWKKEVYGSGGSSWKANAECVPDHLKKDGNPLGFSRSKEQKNVMLVEQLMRVLDQ